MQEQIDTEGIENNNSNITENETIYQKKEVLNNTIQVSQVSQSRRTWLCITHCLTFWIPTFLLPYFGMRDPQVQIAWKEKIALNLIIMIISALFLFLIVGISLMICPPLHVLSSYEIELRNKPSNPYVSAYGNYYQISPIYNSHVNTKRYLNEGAMKSTCLGRDVSAMFVKTDHWKKYCPGLVQPEGWDNIKRDIPEDAMLIWTIHQKKTKRGTSVDFLANIKPLMKGQIARDQIWITNYLAADPISHFVLVAYGRVFDVSQYMDPVVNPTFLGKNLKQIIQTMGQTGKDATSAIEQIKDAEGIDTFKKYMQCLDGMFFTGVIDTRKSTNCIISDYIVLVTSICLIVIIGFKFFAALQFSPKSQPEQHERFVICCVPSFTEGHKSLKETIDSLCESIYKKEKKLLFIIADGLIKGTGNDRTTPDIIMGILGTDKSNPAPPRVYHALGEDMKQLNLARVYSGQYLGVPYILVMKIGDVLEKIRPGNRGKRDSQLILMNFLSKCHADMPLNPLELELKYHFHYRIKVDPRNYEFLLWMDSDTTIYPDALSRFVSHMAKDSSISGICGETLLRNEDESWVTMIQVYEYFITHHLAKSFESLFGTVTCLPGCFCMYRIFHQSDMSPILVSPKIIQSYGENNVNTLHLKNLLSLGEDRYLTTLMLKSFPQHKLKFTPDAKAQTSAPSQWGVLLSQRRRWINSTVHNLSELMLLKDLCGCFVFSLRFVVIMDLFSTVMAPAGFLYVIYLIVLLCTTEMIQIPLISIIMICAIYGLQVLIFILKGEWQHIGWMILYILAIPVYSFVLPIYSFWHFDDFTWGSTRRVELDEEFGDMIVTKAKFDQSLIPQKSWVQYQRQDLKWRISQDKLLSPTQQQESTSGSSSSAYSLMEEDLKQKMLLLIPDILQNDSTASDAKIHNLLTNKLQRNIDEGLSKICIDQVRYVSSSEFEK